MSWLDGFAAWREQLLAHKYLGWLFDGWLVTLWAAVLVIAASTVLGLLFAVLRSSPSRPLRCGAKAYISLFRNTPLLVQLFFWYFGAPSLLPEVAREWLYTSHVWPLFGGLVSLRWPSFEFSTAILGLVLYATAYVGEEIRSGIRGVAQAQSHAASALGMTRWQVMRFVVLPQALRITLSPLMGQYMNIVKNTSLTMAVGLVELSYTSRQVEADTFKTFQAFGIATLLYVATIAAMEVLSAWLAGRARLAKASTSTPVAESAGQAPQRVNPAPLPHAP
ncbi:amino acid ABC transporter permease [Variovorax sp. HJSM1_2]|uniref:amino acid ABC transporter permease n=1 Tax=Variovorax sp. HJSM1_2 TaxID=3366263 RepID=UPI003BE60F4C